MDNMDNMTFFSPQGRVPEILVHSTFSVPGSGVPLMLAYFPVGALEPAPCLRDEARWQRSQIPS